MPVLSSSVHFRIRKPGASRTWLPYFLAAFGAGGAVADEELLRYHWVMPEAAPEKAARVVRVLGEKGERFEEGYAEDTLAELKQHPAIMEARIARQAALRREALELARQLREEGKEPLVAYEEAWTQVYSRSWLSGGWLSGSCKLEDMLRRLASEGEEQELTEDEKQWLLEALLEDDDQLESEAGVELLRRLAAQLRQKGYGFSTVSSGLNDELMQRFAAGLQHQSDSMAAYRDALFKTRRGQIMTHSLVGYRAPWGMGVGGGAYYRQAPQPVETTEGSGNTQMPAQPVLLQEKKEPIIAHGLNDVPEAVTDFLATAPPSLEEEDNDEKEKEEEEDTLADSESESKAAAPAMIMMRSFSMRPMAYAARSGDENPAVPESGAGDALYWNSAGDAPAVWDTAQTQAWRDANGGELAYTAGSHVVFGDGAGLNKTVQIAEEGVAADSVTITGSNYLFQGGNMMVTERLNAAKSASLESTLVMGSTTTPLVIDVAGGDVAGGETLTLSNLATYYILDEGIPIYRSGSFTKTGSGTLSITDAVHGTITGVTVQEGALELGTSEAMVAMDVGANRVTGGCLENVQMLVTSDIERPATGDTVTVHNIITSVDGTNPGILRDVTLYAGTSTEYATLHRVVFAGVSTLTGYITMEKTQSQRDIGVATGGTLTLVNVTFDLHGMASGSKELILNGALDDNGGQDGTLLGWGGVNFVYSGVAVNQAAVNTFVAGKVTLNDEHKGDLTWTGGAQDGMWNTSSQNWRKPDGKDSQFLALSNVIFAGGGEAQQEISVTQDMVVMDLKVNGGDYHFKGARIAALGKAELSSGVSGLTFDNQLVVQDSLTTSGPGAIDFNGNVTVAQSAVLNNLTTTIHGDMTVVNTLKVGSGDAANAGHLTITGNVMAQDMEFAVSAGAASDSNKDYDATLVEVSGNLTALGTKEKPGTITIGGTAKQHYAGVVTAGNLVVNTRVHDVTFNRIHVDKLEVGAGSTVHVKTSADSVAVSSSSFDEIDLYGTLALDAAGATYNHGYQVNVLSSTSKLLFGSGCTIENLTIVGKKLEDSGYSNLVIDGDFRSASVKQMQNLGNLTVEKGSLTVKNAAGAVHGELFLNNGKLKLGEETNDIMASGSGAVRLENGGLLDIGKSSQTLSANNVVSLSGSSSITGDADGPGLLLGNNVCVNYKDAGNSIDAKLTVVKDITLNSTSAGSSLEISGLISGGESINLTGPGSVVLSGANTGFNGQVTVQQGSTLTLQNTDALLNAGVVLNEGATLVLDAPDAVTLKALTFSTGSTLDISSIVGTDGLSAQDAALQVRTFNIGSNALTLNVHFADTLDTMTTYNIMSGLSSGKGLSLNVEHNGVKLDDSQYTLGVHNGVLYIYTMMGNVWDGARDDIWFAEDTDTQNGNWSGLKYIGKKEEGYTAAIFRDLAQGTEPETVTVQGVVAPGDIYFTAHKTAYVLDSAKAGGHLAAGTNIHKIGENVVTLNLENNATVDTALGDVEVLAGKLILDSALAAKGAVSVGGEEGVSLVLNKGKGALEMYADAGDTPSYTYTVSAIKDASAELRGVTMDAAGIRGTKDVYNAAIKDDIDAAEINASNLLVQGNAELQYLILKDFEAAGNVTLSDVTLTSSSSTATTLTDVTIGSGVVVDASGSYILSGKNLTFDSALTNKGTVTLDIVTKIDNETDNDDLTIIEIGKINYDTRVGTYGNTEYVYEFISSTGGGVLYAPTLSADNFSINGVNLGSGLKDKDGVKFTDNRNGSITLSIYDGTVSMPQWDERWGKTEKAPSLSRRYAGNADYVELAAGLELDESDARDTNYYRYSSIVHKDNADKVNAGQAIVVTLAEGAKGKLVVGGRIEKDRVTGDILWGSQWVHNVEVWIEDRSSVKNIIGGLDNGLDNPWGHATPTAQTSATHVLVDADFLEKDYIPNKYSEWDKSYVIAGSRWCDQYAESYVTVRSGEIYNVFGGSCGGHYSGACEDYVNDGDPCPIVSDNAESAWWGFSDLWVTQYGTSHVYVEGGRIGEIFAGGVYANLNVGAGNRAVEMILTGGVVGGADLRVFGGANHGDVTGDIYVRMEGSAKIKSRLVGGSNAGTVNGNIVLDLISGEAFRVDAAGLGWYSEWKDDNGKLHVYNDPARIKGNVQVNLYSDFKLGIGAEGDLASGIYGGREQSNHIILVNGDDGSVHTSTLHFAEGEKYELGFIGGDGYTTSEASHIVTGFDRFVMEEKAHAVLGLGKFDIDMDANKTLYIEGKGVVEVIGHGANLGRNIQLEKDATLKISTSVIGASGSEDDRTITVTDGSTIDFSGAPAETAYARDLVYAGLGFNVVIEGYGVDGKGAIYKGKYDGPYDLTAEGATSTANRIVLPNVELTNSASVNVAVGETLYMNGAEQGDQGDYVLGETHLTLNNHTFTKLGAGDFIARSVEMTPGTVLVQQGAFGFDLTDDASQTDMVLAADGELKLNASGLKTGGATNLTLRSLSGAGAVKLNGSTLTLHTEADSPYDSPYYYGEYMTDEYRNDAQDYDQFSETTGFGYAVFSGMISDAKGGGKLVKTGTGVHYISGSSSTYTGGTLLQKGCLYLLGTSETGKFVKNTASVDSDVYSSVDSGVAGTGDIVWESADAKLYLGHGTRIYNNGMTKVAGGVMTIGVEGALSGVLEGYEGIHGTVTMGGERYVEIETHNLKSIPVDGLYADGTVYKANDEINRNLMLLVKTGDWEASKTEKVTLISDDGYNEAVYSGVLYHDSNVTAGLSKVGGGTLVLDQRNLYTGGTTIEGGTLRLRGWATLGSNEKNNTATVQEGATLMFTHNHGYVNGTTRAANDIVIYGTGDARWGGNSATDGGTAALISAVGPEVVFTLSGDISGSGNVRHCGDGTLVLSGDSDYTGGTVITRGVVDVQSATGLGSTANGAGAVVLGENADLHVTVEDGTKGKRLVTTLASVNDAIKGDVKIGGKGTVERILHMEGNGYDAATTTLEDKGTFLLCGNGKTVSSHSDFLTGSGTVVVCDASGAETKATFDTIVDYTGDFWVVGNNAAIEVKYGTYSEGSINVIGHNSQVHIDSNVSITAGEKLRLSSMGGVPSQPVADGEPALGSGAGITSKGMVSVAAGAVLEVSRDVTHYDYDLSWLKDELSLTPGDVTLPQLYKATEVNCQHINLGTDISYEGRFDTSIGVNQQAVGGVKADGGLTLAGGSTYETYHGHTSLMGGALTLETLDNNQITFRTTLDFNCVSDDNDAQLVLFSDVSSVTLLVDGEMKTAKTDSGVYYTQADRYLTGCDYINSQTLLVYDSHAEVVYLQIKTPEPTTTALSLVALAAMAARRRRKRD